MLSWTGVFVQLLDRPQCDLDVLQPVNYGDLELKLVMLNLRQTECALPI
jgi:hypothetical protein